MIALGHVLKRLNAGYLLQSYGHAGQTDGHLKTNLRSLKPKDDSASVLQRCSLPADDECSPGTCRAISAGDV